MDDAADPPIRRSATAPAAASGPAADLADVWNLLDALPAATASVDLAAATVDLVAAKVASGEATADRPAADLGLWAVRAATVAVALVAGFAAGRAWAERLVLQRLPLIEHLGLLQEAGSVDFLEAVAERMAGRQGLPRWMRFAREPQELQGEAREFDAAIAALRAEGADEHVGDDLLEARRRRVASLPAAERAELERSAEAFDALSNVDRRDVEELARALVAPANERLRDAARAWHVVVASMNPVSRHSVVAMSVAERLEVMEWQPGRFEPRPPGRPRDEFRDRRPPEFRDEADGPRPRPPRDRPDGPPRQGFPRPFNGPWPAGGRPAGGPPDAGGPPGAPGETRAPPR